MFPPDHWIYPSLISLGSLLLEGGRNNPSCIVGVFRDSTALPWCRTKQHLPLTTAASMPIVTEKDDIGNARKC